jgi:hypothetical protein
MTPEQYSDFLKIRRTKKLFKKFEIPVDHKQMLIDAVNFAPAQNCQRNFIPVLIDRKDHREWLVDKIFYMDPKWDTKLNYNLPKEYMKGIVDASFVVLYLEVAENFPLVSHHNINYKETREKDKNQITIMNINLGMNMSFLANQAYLLNYDVGFIGCARGAATLNSKNGEFLSFIEHFGLTELYEKHKFIPTYCVCVGKAYDIEDYGEYQIDKKIKGVLYKDGFFTNRKKHTLDPVEFLRTGNG